LWTSKRLESGSRDRIAVGDAELYLGWDFERAGITELRLGLIFPAGYDTRDGDPWIGPGNVQVTLGAALNPSITRYSRRWEISTEWKWAYALNDAIAKSGKRRERWPGKYALGRKCERANSVPILRPHSRRRMRYLKTNNFANERNPSRSPLSPPSRVT
jgi:hypothetical protein